MNWQELFHIDMFHGYIPQILIAELIFFLHQERKQRFGLRVSIGLPVFLCSAVLIPNVIAHYVSGFFSMTIFLLSLAFWNFCMETTTGDLLFSCVAAQLVQNLSYHVENLVYLPFISQFTMLGRLIWSLVCMVLVYTAAYLILERRLLNGGSNLAHRKYIFGFAVVTTLFVYIMQYLFQVYQIDQLWITRPPLILCCIFGLCVQFGFMELGREQENNLMLEQMIAKEHQHYEFARENMDAINRKAHDLKHQIARMRSMNNADEQELREIEAAVAQYELSFHTGNATLDTILSDKQYICNQQHIELSVMAQGEVLDFLRPGEIASLFGNALDNAIECEKTIEDVNKRCIAVQLFENKGLVCLRVENYCPNEVMLRNELPRTTKPDRMDHGFGLRSIQYIAEHHHGSLCVSCDHQLFTLNVLMQKE